MQRKGARTRVRGQREDVEGREELGVWFDAESEKRERRGVGLLLFGLQVEGEYKRKMGQGDRLVRISHD